ncbi:MAG: radical SAM protein [Micrococcales bacterium]|nr:radical SAM protein [Micrococcales bacterium]
MPINHHTSKVYLCDLTHTDGKSISSNVFPLGIGLLAAYVAMSDEGNYFSFDLFKYPADLNNHLLTESLPTIIGFSNYSWNLELSVAFARAIKGNNPNIVTIFGGPNYGLKDDETGKFWSDFGDCIDFYIVLEGEIGFYSLLSSLRANDFDISKTKAKSHLLLNAHYIASSGALEKTEISPRVAINELPSPYLDTNLMEKFFDGKLIPLTHTTRGCPFKCTFCSEGSEYFNKVKQRTFRVAEEFNYIARRATSVGMFDLMLSDANYGMFKEDNERADALARTQSEYNYPKSVYVSTGKNQKSRVLSVVKKLGGAIQLSASLQTTDEEVLKNIARSNISIDVLSEAAREASDSNVSSYTELILGLPGETLDSHLKSVIEVIEAGFTNVRIYQLILLPQTELNTSETRARFGFQTSFRPMPRSFGNYPVLGTNRFVLEYEEIVVASNTMPRADYDLARKADLMIELIHNGNIFREVKQILSNHKLKWSLFLSFVLEKVRSNTIPKSISTNLEAFIALMQSRLFATRRELLEAVARRQSHGSLSALATNEFAHFKAQIIIKDFETLNDFVFDSLEEYIALANICAPPEILLATRKYCSISKANPFQCNDPLEFKHYLNRQASRELWSIVASNSDWGDYFSDGCESSTWTLRHNPSQQDEIKRLLDLYGDSDEGMARIVMRAPIIDKYFRRPLVQSLTT